MVTSCPFKCRVPSSADSLTAGVFRNITHLEIVKNPIQEKYEKHVRQFLIASVPHLVSVNGTTVSIAEKQKSLDVFGTVFLTVGERFWLIQGVGGHAKAFSLKSKLLSASGDLSPSPLTEASELDLFSQACQFQRVDV